MQQQHQHLIFITLVASLGGFLFGFDMAVVSGILPFVEHQFSLSPAQLGWFVSSALAGCIAGVIFASDLSDRFGRKKLLFLSAALFVLTALGCTLLPAFSWLIAARILGGMAVGIASSVVPLYLSEIAPDHLRGRLVTYYQLAVTVGIFCAYTSNALLLKYAATPSQNGWLLISHLEVWRKMFGVATFPALFFLLGIIFIPESPRWARQHRTITTANATGYTQLLAPRSRHALLIAILLPLFSQFSGINAIIYYGPVILHQSGLTLDNSLISQLFFGAANVLFTFIAIWKVDSLGRRPLYLWGTAGAAISLLLTGICFYTGAVNGIYLLLCVLAFLACFAFSIGPLKFVIAAEIFPDSIRAKALSLSIMVMWTADAIMGQLTPVMLAFAGTPQTFWCFALCCVFAFITVYKLVPETKGQSMEDIQRHWLH
ncbi:MFS transporter [Chitinophaga sp.]|uniref:MFS transporter n=1 Tax=Chitinophaga sp. TaxID=1869181 RepID=UPI002F94BA6C